MRDEKSLIFVNSSFFRLADELETHSSKALENVDFYLGNPVNAYLFVKRFTVDWERHIEDILKWKPNEGIKCINYAQHWCKIYK